MAWTSVSPLMGQQVRQAASVLPFLTWWRAGQAASSVGKASPSWGWKGRTVPDLSISRAPQWCWQGKLRCLQLCTECANCAIELLVSWLTWLFECLISFQRIWLGLPMFLAPTARVPKKELKSGVIHPFADDKHQSSRPKSHPNQAAIVAHRRPESLIGRNQSR